LQEDCTLELNAMDFGKLSVTEHIIVDGDDLKLTNTIAAQTVSIRESARTLLWPMAGA